MWSYFSWVRLNRASDSTAASGQDHRASDGKIEREREGGRHDGGEEQDARKGECY